MMYPKNTFVLIARAYKFADLYDNEREFKTVKEAFDAADGKVGAEVYVKVEGYGLYRVIKP